MKTIVSLVLVFGLCGEVAHSQEKAPARTCTEGIFTFKVPSNLTRIQGPKVQSLKNQMMQGGRELAKASGTADPYLFAESSLTFFSAYESAAGDMLFILLGDKSPTEMSRGEMFNTNSERIRWGKNSGQLSSGSKGAFQLDIDGIPSLLMDIVSPNGERLQTYTFFVPDHPKHSFAITFKTPKGQYQATIDEILGSLKIARTKASLPGPEREGANQQFRRQPETVMGNTQSAIQPGDTVVVANEGAKLMAGNTVITLLKAGTEMKVTKVSGKWIAVTVAVNGANTVGWVSIDDLKPLSTKPAPKADAVASPAGSVPDTRIHDAAKTGDMAAVRALLEKQPGLLNAPNNDGQTPLHVAAKNGHKEIVGLLLEKGAEVNARDRFQGTPLHWAVFYGHKEVAELLLVKGAAVNTKERKGWTPLHYAAWKGYKDLAELLIANDADVNAQQEEGMTPLHEAALSGKKDMAKLLARKGAKSELKDNKGYTPYQYALAQTTPKLSKPPTAALPST